MKGERERDTRGVEGTAVLPLSQLSLTPLVALSLTPLTALSPLSQLSLTALTALSLALSQLSLAPSHSSLSPSHSSLTLSQRSHPLTARSPSHSSLSLALSQLSLAPSHSSLSRPLMALRCRPAVQGATTRRPAAGRRARPAAHPARGCLVERTITCCHTASPIPDFPAPGPSRRPAGAAALPTRPPGYGDTADHSDTDDPDPGPPARLRAASCYGAGRGGGGTQGHSGGPRASDRRLAARGNHGLSSDGRVRDARYGTREAIELRQSLAAGPVGAFPVIVCESGADNRRTSLREWRELCALEACESGVNCAH